MRRSTLYTLAIVFAIAALFFIMTTTRAKVECRVCVDYHGQSNCATARAGNRSGAVEGAQSTACGPVASGMDQQIECSRIAPASVQCRS